MGGITQAGASATLACSLHFLLLKGVTFAVQKRHNCLYEMLVKLPFAWEKIVETERCQFQCSSTFFVEEGHETICTALSQRFALTTTKKGQSLKVCLSSLLLFVVLQPYQ